MKVVVMTSSHEAFDRRIFHRQCVTLRKAGLEVVLVVSTSAVYESVVKGIRLVTVRRRSDRAGRMLISAFRVWRAAMLEGGDAFHIHDPELIPWAMLAKLFRRRVVMDVHEDYVAQVAGAKWIPRMLRGPCRLVVRQVERVAANVFDGIIVADEALERKFRTYARRAQIACVRNLPEVHSNALEAHEDLGSEAPTTPRILFLGGVTSGRCAAEFVAALELLRDLSFYYIIAGNAVDQSLLTQLRKSPVWKEESFLGRLSADEVDLLLPGAAVSVNLFADLPNNRGLRSNRLFEALAAGVPVLVSSHSEAATFVNDHRCGLAVKESSITAIADALRYLLTSPADARKMGMRGRELVLHSYSWKKEGEHLTTLYDRILPTERRRD